jgi:hypothetical protein
VPRQCLLDRLDGKDEVNGSSPLGGSFESRVVRGLAEDDSAAAGAAARTCRHRLSDVAARVVRSLRCRAGSTCRDNQRRGGSRNPNDRRGPDT